MPMTRRAKPSPPSANVDPRLHVSNGRDPASGGSYVLYWCRAYRRAQDNLALDHAVRRADELGLPLLVYEALDVRYPYASDRIHRFVLEGACEMKAALEARGIGYVFFVPRNATEAKRSRAVERLAEHAALVVTDWYPNAGGAHSLWAHTTSLASRIACRFEAYDDAVAVPMALLGKAEIAARTIRPKVNAALETYLVRSNDPSPKHRFRTMPDLSFEPTRVTAAALDELVASCAIDHTVAPVDDKRGGRSEALARLDRFTARPIRNYASERNDMARIATSTLSPYIHFGHVSVREVAIAARESSGGDESIEAFVEELVVRRSLAFNYVMTEPDHATYAGIPDWARDQLEKHEADERPMATDYQHWMRGETDDVLWNAAQRELLRDGVVHPYARMLWGKVGIALARHPKDAFAWLVELNDRFALDGRDPNTYANISWCFGTHDHPFPGRPIYGTVRSMTSRSAAQKWDVSAYLARVGMRSDAWHEAESARREAKGAEKKRATRGKASDEYDQRTEWDE
jgi:photolyase PhrII